MSREKKCGSVCIGVSAAYAYVVVEDGYSKGWLTKREIK